MSTLVRSSLDASLRFASAFVVARDSPKSRKPKYPNVNQTIESTPYLAVPISEM